MNLGTSTELTEKGIIIFKGHYADCGSNAADGKATNMFWQLVIVAKNKEVLAVTICFKGITSL